MFGCSRGGKYARWITFFIFLSYWRGVFEQVSECCATRAGLSLTVPHITPDDPVTWPRDLTFRMSLHEVRTLGSNTTVSLSPGRWPSWPFPCTAIVPADVNSSSSGRGGNHFAGVRPVIWQLSGVSGGVNCQVLHPLCVWVELVLNDLSFFFFLLLFTHSALLGGGVNKSMFKQEQGQIKEDWSGSNLLPVKGSLSLKTLPQSTTCID